MVLEQETRSRFAVRTVAARRAGHAAARGILLAILAVLVAGDAAGGAPGDAGVRSPEVAADGRVTFRLLAPEAETALFVFASGQPVAMTRDETGVWSHTTEPLEPDLYSYFFVVDGLPRSDVLNPLGKPVMTGGVESIAHVPGPAELVWEVGEVPRGEVHRHAYASEAIGEEREYYVYTPPGYDPGGERRYPVLYLLHGLGDDATAWRVAGRADVILDNLVARGEIEPMLVVMPLGYGFERPAERMWEVVNNVPAHRRAQEVAATALTDEILPRVEAEYRAAADRGLRAIAGLSMGGSQALLVGLRRLDLFAWVGSFSGAFMMFTDGFDAAFATLDERAGERLRLLWITCGERDFVLPVNHQMRDWLAERELPLTWSETSGGHTWRVWRRNLADFARLLFRPPDTIEPAGRTMSSRPMSPETQHEESGAP